MIALRDACVHLGTRRWALPDLDLRPGARVQLVGPSGCGKTTLLRAIAGLIASEGLVLVCGTRLDTLPASARSAWRARHVGYLRHDAPLLGLHSALEEAQAHAWIRGDQAESEASQCLAALGIRAEAAPSSLSAGQRQRVGIARALLGAPPLVLLDEPLAHLDAAAIDAVRVALAALPSHTTVVLASHGPTLPGFHVLDLRAPPARVSAPPAQVAPAPQATPARGLGRRLAARTLRQHPRRTLTLLAAATLPIALVLGSLTALWRTEAALQAAAEAAPVLISASPDPWRAALAGVQLRGQLEEGLTVDDLQALRDGFEGSFDGLRLGHTAGGLPLVAASPEFWQSRAPHVLEGRMPLLPGEVALGQRAATALQLGTGDVLRVDPAPSWEPTLPAPPRLQVVGVLPRLGSALDHALLTPLGTAWQIEGQLHSHDPTDAPQTADPLGLLVSDARPGQIHAHGPLPLSLIAGRPATDRDRDLLLARFATDPHRHAIEPPRLLAVLRAEVMPYAAPIVASLIATCLASLVLAGLVLQLAARLREPRVTTWRELGMTPAQERSWLLWEGCMLLAVAASVAALAVATLATPF